jgi:hypothetical protein
VRKNVLSQLTICVPLQCCEPLRRQRHLTS